MIATTPPHLQVAARLAVRNCRSNATCRMRMGQRGYRRPLTLTNHILQLDAHFPHLSFAHNRPVKARIKTKNIFYKK